ncbi:MAG: hypothetical protein ACXIUV_13855 [Alkalilacustris sp.]
MQLSDATHDYACTRCATTGGVCMEALWLARRLAAGVTGRLAQLPADFELSSSTRFSGCGQDCAVALHVTANEVEIASGRGGARITATPHPVAGAVRAGG